MARKKGKSISLNPKVNLHFFWPDLERQIRILGKAEKIDAEVKGIVTNAYDLTCRLINENMDTLHNMANALLERETLSGEDIEQIMASANEEAALEDSPKQ